MVKKEDIEALKKEREYLIEEIANLNNSRPISFTAFIFSKISGIVFLIFAIKWLFFNGTFASSVIFYLVILFGLYLFVNKPFFYEKENFRLFKIRSFISYVIASMDEEYLRENVFYPVKEWYSRRTRKMKIKIYKLFRKKNDEEVFYSRFSFLEEKIKGEKL